MSRVFWDTNLFIYLTEDYPEHGAKVAALRRRMLERGDTLYTSALTLGEVLVLPIRAGNADLRVRYESALASVAVIPFDREAAAVFAAVRAAGGVRAPDAIQLACASVARTDLLITNDERLSQQRVAGIQFITSLDRAPL